MENILTKIISTKFDEVSSKKAQCSIEKMMGLVEQSQHKPRGFRTAIMNNVDSGKNAIIAEVKQASPSKGIICHNFDAKDIAKTYSDNGASCLSVLTDEVYFRGSLQNLCDISKTVDLPLLRKDFIIDEYQVYESFLNNADAILLIVACLSENRISALANVALSLGMDVLIEVHSAEELKVAKKLAKNNSVLIGVNNRNLNTFEVDINTTIELKQLMLDNKYLVCESGIKSKYDIEKIRNAGVKSFLVGEGFLVQNDPGSAMKELFSL